MIKSVFANFISSQPDSNILNSMGCQLKIHAFNTLNFII